MADCILNHFLFLYFSLGVTTVLTKSISCNKRFVGQLIRNYHNVWMTSFFFLSLSLSALLREVNWWNSKGEHHFCRMAVFLTLNKSLLIKAKECKHSTWNFVYVIICYKILAFQSRFFFFFSLKQEQIIISMGSWHCIGDSLGIDFIHDLKCMQYSASKVGKHLIVL